MSAIDKNRKKFKTAASLVPYQGCSIVLSVRLYAEETNQLAEAKVYIMSFIA